MTTENPHPEKRGSDRLHPVLWRAAAFAGIWMVFAAWGFFGRGYTDYVLVIVSGFLLFAIGLPALLWLNWRRHRDRLQLGRRPHGKFRDWLGGEFETRDGRLKGSDAAFAVLLPLAAVAIGMTAFALVLHFVVRGGS